jgi:hypothetical protein
MKILVSTVVSFGILVGSFIKQDVPVDKIPNEVKNAFARNFNNPSDVEWERKRDGYEVDFDLGNVDHAALYTAAGELLMIKMELNEQDLSPAISQRINEDFRGYKIDNIDQVKMGTRVLYQIALEGRSEDRKVVYNAKGELEDNFDYWD